MGKRLHNSLIGVCYLVTHIDIGYEDSAQAAYCSQIRDIHFVCPCLLEVEKLWGLGALSMLISSIHLNIINFCFAEKQKRDTLSTPDKPFS